MSLWLGLWRAVLESVFRLYLTRLDLGLKSLKGLVKHYSLGFHPHSFLSTRTVTSSPRVLLCTAGCASIELCISVSIWMLSRPRSTSVSAVASCVYRKVQGPLACLQWTLQSDPIPRSYWPINNGEAQGLRYLYIDFHPGFWISMDFDKILSNWSDFEVFIANISHSGK